MRVAEFDFAQNLFRRLVKLRHGHQVRGINRAQRTLRTGLRKQLHIKKSQAAIGNKVGEKTRPNRPFRPACANRCTTKKVQTPLVRTARDAFSVFHEPSGKVQFTFGLDIVAVAESYSPKCQWRWVRAM